MKKVKILCALVATFAVAGTAAAQEGTLKKIKDSGSITIGHRDASVPFSYYDDKQQPIGYSMDLCMKIVDAVKAELKMPALKVNYQLVTSANRIPLMANGTIDLECGSTTNNIARQEQVVHDTQSSPPTLGLQEVVRRRHAGVPQADHRSTAATTTSRHDRNHAAPNLGMHHFGQRT